MFENIQDDTQEIFMEEFGELVVVYTHISYNEIKILMFALKFCTMPNMIDLDDNACINLDEFRVNQDQFVTCEYKIWMYRIKQYLPKFHKWSKSKNLHVTNYTLMEVGVIPEVDRNIKMPSKPVYKLNYLEFLNTNIFLIFKCVINILGILFTPHKVSKRINSASIVISQIEILYQHRQRTATQYFIITTIYVGCILSAIFATILSKIL